MVRQFRRIYPVAAVITLRILIVKISIKNAYFFIDDNIITNCGSGDENIDDNDIIL